MNNTPKDTAGYVPQPVLDSHGAHIPNLYQRHDRFYFLGQVAGRRYVRRIPHSTVVECRAWIKRFQKLALSRTDETCSSPGPAFKALRTAEDLAGAYRAAAAVHRALLDKPSVRTVEKNITSFFRIVGGAGTELASVGPVVATAYLSGQIEKAGVDHMRRHRARVSAGSTLRQAKSLFAKWALAQYAQDRMSLPPSILQFKETGSTTKPDKYRLPPADLITTTLQAGESLKGTDPALYAGWILCYHAGLRVGEAMNARWSWLESRDGVTSIRICRRPEWRGPKNLRDHSIPLSAGVLESLMVLRGVSPFILPGETPTARHNLLNRRFAAWMRGIGWDRVTYPKAAHELRKLAGSYWFTKLGLQWSAEWLGDSIQTVAHYYSACTAPRAALDMRAWS
jgi:integrase